MLWRSTGGAGARLHILRFLAVAKLGTAVVFLLASSGRDGKAEPDATANVAIASAASAALLNLETILLMFSLRYPRGPTQQGIASRKARCQSIKRAGIRETR